jgi:parallel beta-helix repeat protein
MNRLSGIAILVGILVLILAGNAVAGTRPRDPIRIRSEADLCPENGVVSGRGTVEEPYVISGWAIDVERGTGIEIRGILCHLLIRDCTLTGSPRGTTGILVSAAPHTRITGCTLTGLDTGVFLYQGSGACVEACRSTGCRRAVEASESDGIVIADNRIEAGAQNGLFLWRCDDARLVENMVSGCADGVYLDSCQRGELLHNHVDGGDHGIFLWDSFDCTVAWNTVQDSELGLAVVHTSEGNRLFGNAVFDVERPATCDRAANQWDAGYPAGGNYWAGEAFEDRFSGPDQDEPGADGIADASRAIPFSGVDRYPLAAAPENAEESH